VSMPRRNDYLLWYAKDAKSIKFRRLFKPKDFYEETEHYNLVLESDATIRRISIDERRSGQLPTGSRVFRYIVLTKPGPGQKYVVKFNGKEYTPGTRWWGFQPESMQRLIESGRIVARGNSLESIRYLDDFPYTALDNVWT